MRNFVRLDSGLQTGMWLIANGLSPIRKIESAWNQKFHVSYAKLNRILKEIGSRQLVQRKKWLFKLAPLETTGPDA